MTCLGFKENILSGLAGLAPDLNTCSLSPAFSPDCFDLGMLWSFGTPQLGNGGLISMETKPAKLCKVPVAEMHILKGLGQF